MVLADQEEGTPVGSREERIARQRAAIEMAGIGLFEANGFDAVSVEEIAVAAGVSRATAFRYYGSKEAILFANHERELGVLIDLLDAHPAARDSVAAFRVVIHEFARALEREGEALRRRARIVTGHERLMAIAQGTGEEWSRVITDWLAGGGRPSPRQEVLAALGVDALRLGTRRWYQSDAATPLAAHVDAVFDDIVATFAQE